jgi:tellurite resistance protein
LIHKRQLKEMSVSEPQSPAFSKAQLVALVESMLSTARVDGVHPKEEALIRAFYEEQRQSGMLTYDKLAAAEKASKLEPLSADVAFAEQLLLMCLMAGYADGKFSEAERSHVAKLGGRLSVPPARLAELHLQVKDSLIGSLARLPDAQSVAALAKTL